MGDQRPRRPAQRPAVVLPHVDDKPTAKALSDLAERIRDIETDAATVTSDGMRGFEVGRDNEGDIYYRPRGGGIERLAVGVPGDLLTVGIDELPEWAPAGASSVADFDYGDITVSGGGLAWAIDADAVTFAKMANLATDRLIGRDTAGTGDPESLTVGGGLEFTGSGGIQIAADGVTFAKFQDLTTDRLVGRDTAGTGDAEQISVGGGLEFTGSTSIQRSALTGDVTATAGSGTTTIAADAVTNAKLADMATMTVKANITGGTANPTDVPIAAFAATFNPPGVFGDGSDGTVTLGAGTTTLARDMFYDVLTVPSGSTLACAGYRVFVRATLTVDAGGVISNDGVTAPSSSGGGVCAGGTLAAANGAGGNAASNATPGTPTGVTQALGGAGGAGGNGSGAGTGGNPGTVGAPVANAGHLRSVPFAIMAGGIGFAGGSVAGTTLTITPFRGGSGGGGGNGNGLNVSAGGGGGGGGGVLVVVARVTVNSGAIQANGGAGRAGDSSGGGGGGWGGGGGGGGGVAILVTDSLTGSNPVANGGTGGALVGTGSANGTDGSPGFTLVLHS